MHSEQRFVVAVLLLMLFLSPAPAHGSNASCSSSVPADYVAAIGFATDNTTVIVTNSSGVTWYLRVNLCNGTAKKPSGAATCGQQGEARGEEMHVPAASQSHTSIGDDAQRLPLVVLWDPWLNCSAHFATVSSFKKPTTPGGGASPYGTFHLKGHAAGGRVAADAYLSFEFRNDVDKPVISSVSYTADPPQYTVRGVVPLRDDPYTPGPTTPAPMVPKQSPAQNHMFVLIILCSVSVVAFVVALAVYVRLRRRAAYRGLALGSTLSGFSMRSSFVARENTNDGDYGAIPTDD